MRVLCFSGLTSVLVGASPAETDPVPPPAAVSDGQIGASFQDRRLEFIDRYVARTEADNPEWGSLPFVAVNMAQGTNLDWARHRLRELTKAPTGAMFWMYPMVLVMKAGAPHLDADDWAVIREAWRTYFPYRGDTENHWVMYYASIYLAAETWPDLGPEGWYNGKSSAENRAEAKDYILDWIRITTTYGRGEYDSPNYIDPYVSALTLLTAWCQDPELQRQAEMMLEYELLDFAVENLGGIYGGAHSRIYPKHAMQPALGASTSLAWLLWGQGELQLNGSALIVALSGWSPPAILQRIATDRDDAYVHRELKRTRWRMRHAGPDAIDVEDHSTVPVYKYSYVTPDYLLGSSQGGLLQPIQQQSWSMIWHEAKPLGISNTFFALHPHYSAEEGTMYFGADADTVVDLIARSKVDYNSPDKLMSGSPYEQIFQDHGAVIGLYDIEPGTSFQHLNTFFSRDLQSVTEDESGWIFAIGGPTYIAYRPFVAGEWRPSDWTGLLAGGAGAWISSNHDEWGAGHKIYVSENPKNGYVAQIASAADFPSFAAFQAAVRALPLQFGLEPTPTVRFTTLDGTVMKATYGERPTVNGNALDYEHWPLFDGPFARAARGSNELLMRHDQESRHLDFKATQVTTRISPSSR
ncbi:hypothetical protein PXH66_19590 [Synoicihabitans lomoniglobus]|uniref:Uncharacterized protein n=1 Tax=Synoicihabitans lomoniglobus TaxID=2909285 RepID=A0AAF0CNL3_9BACT|nr:hypothetical protein PXH66_19590 [Opitutaceae bacterium LMO-M01]